MGSGLWPAIWAAALELMNRQSPRAEQSEAALIHDKGRAARRDDETAYVHFNLATESDLVEVSHVA
ncbi:MAG TPA: hypothetical protein DCM14_03305 [Clostridiales bacterium UBA8153]|nr:hypothetical protein [Clostridiales bacterium UBA8153]